MRPHSQGGLLQSFLYNVWKWSVTWNLRINPTKCDFIGRAPILYPLTLKVRALSHSFSPPIHSREAASKARPEVSMIRRPFTELSVSSFIPIYNKWVSPNFEYAMGALLPTRIVWRKYSGWRRGSLRVLANCHMRNDYVGGSALPKQARPP